MVTVLVHQEYITMAGRVAQVVEWHLSKHEALSSNPRTALKKEYIANINKHLPKNTAPYTFLKY
jgi:hypothetical protein